MQVGVVQREAQAPRHNLGGIGQAVVERYGGRGAEVGFLQADHAGLAAVAERERRAARGLNLGVVHPGQLAVGQADAAVAAGPAVGDQLDALGQEHHVAAVGGVLEDDRVGGGFHQRGSGDYLYAALCGGRGAAREQPRLEAGAQLAAGLVALFYLVRAVIPPGPGRQFKQGTVLEDAFQREDRLAAGRAGGGDLQVIARQQFCVGRVGGEVQPQGVGRAGRLGLAHFHAALGGGAVVERPGEDEVPASHGQVGYEAAVGVHRYFLPVYQEG